MKLTLHLALRSRVAKSWPLPSPAKQPTEARAKARPTATRFDQDRRELFPVAPDVMLVRRRPSWCRTGRRDRAAYAARSGRSPGSVSARSPGLRTARRLARPARRGDRRPGGRPVLRLVTVSARSPGFPHRSQSAGRRPRPLASQRSGDRGAGPGDLGTAGRGVNCCSPACRGRRGGRGPELGIGISKPAPAMRAATAAAPASPIGQMW